MKEIAHSKAREKDGRGIDFGRNE